ncbi:telomere repeats-binding bouquet formation protein 2 [Bufo bufo]|uniref:telomere repeats-binding bouquet formation protein 2 n=1 Tax=Bufo bufo TaxID=8384 RepID=UPI001ABEB7A8|nr:telomere repeats-binding bouquet formation protein 2 [Bufo bufo]
MLIQIVGEAPYVFKSPVEARKSAEAQGWISGKELDKTSKPSKRYLSIQRQEGDKESFHSTIQAPTTSEHRWSKWKRAPGKESQAAEARSSPKNTKTEPVCNFRSGLTKSEDGIITNSSHQADYLFSMDASHHDTQRIYNSLEYIENKATVFHASFLRSHIQFKTKTMVILGHFILPPPSLHEEIRREIGNFFWEQDNFVDIQQRRDEEDEPMDPEYDKRKTAGREQSADVRLHTLPKYPENNMLSGYTSIDQLRKFSEELHDFIPDTSEYRVLYVHGESSNFPGIKNLNSKK